MARKDDQGRWLDGAGNAVPARYVQAVDKERDKIVETLIGRAQKLAAQIQQFKTVAEALVDGYMDGAAMAAGVTRNPGGNQQLTGFSGDKRVEIKVGQFIDFDERLQFAQAKINNCLKRWSGNADPKLQPVINRAFKTNSKGRVDAKLILGLRNLDIKDQEWEAAMDLIDKSITVTGSKSYWNFSVRDGQGKWVVIPLDIQRV